MSIFKYILITFILFYLFYNSNVNKRSKSLLRSVGTAQGSWDTGLLCPTHLLLPYNVGRQPVTMAWSVLGNCPTASKDDYRGLQKRSAALGTKPISL